MERNIDPIAIQYDEEEQQLRPKYLKDYVGQTEIK